MSSVRSERPSYSPSEQQARIRRCARALKDTQVQVLRQRYSGPEIKAAQEMVARAKAVRQ